ncbi:hypothetical protein [Bradyrhizobium sp. AZCC 1693]|uniref:hypothetical protein n=1 Tax=Bradyrhizobium sp. AZCC 1693 TaxID=3117029 RepID=UPI002FEFC2B4
MKDSFTVQRRTVRHGAKARDTGPSSRLILQRRATSETRKADLCDELISRDDLLEMK